MQTNHICIGSGPVQVPHLDGNTDPATIYQKTTKPRQQPPLQCRQPHTPRTACVAVEQAFTHKGPRTIQHSTLREPAPHSHTAPLKLTTNAARSHPPHHTHPSLQTAIRHTLARLAADSPPRAATRPWTCVKRPWARRRLLPASRRPRGSRHGHAAPLLRLDGHHLGHEL